jgi:hypothetical protein
MTLMYYECQVKCTWCMKDHNADPKCIHCHMSRHLDERFMKETHEYTMASLCDGKCEGVNHLCEVHRAKVTCTQCGRNLENACSEYTFTRQYFEGPCQGQAVWRFCDPECCRDWLTKEEKNDRE